MNKFYGFLLFLLIPILIFIMIAKSYATDLSLADKLIHEKIIKEEIDEIGENIDNVKDDLNILSAKITDIQLILTAYVDIFSSFSQTIDNSIQSSSEQMKLSEDIYEQRITNMLGEPIDFHLSSTSEIKVFELAELGYRGYIAKVKLFSPKVFKIELSNGVIGELETTSNAAKRTNAILAINGGGFGAGVYNGKVVSTMIGGTVIDSKLINTFVRKKNEDLFFVGINKKGDLIGNIPESEKDIMDLNPYQGLSFIPILIKDGIKVELPSPWKKTKHPRTIIGQYANDDLILIVVDGRQGEWSSGITLERLQDKLIELGVKDAYNLDGGGSTAMYFKGKLLNKPSDGDERPVANNILILPE